jgi:hypothetical protein|tara:strand:+ start:2672 stop:2860 length:189 start_codon:yes stop_codon:yes gene_type:complete
MTKEFEMNDILNAVNSILKIDTKKENVVQSIKKRNDKLDVLTLGKQVISGKSDNLVLNQMIE